ncbi:hypothetical protein CCR75_004226 [Bremia lactucae]|uniref:Uncharacterized protein n=1 Tax=Bremia lactucae TaxID=4779 RepID=A0A976FPT8_BRELC|nr:hypothetical protein CCR75_004226 [Bremia lactucae]
MTLAYLHHFLNLSRNTILQMPLETQEARFKTSARCSYGVMVSALDFESSDPGSNPALVTLNQPSESKFRWTLFNVYLRMLLVAEHLH